MIIGAGGFGRELLQYVKHIQEAERRWNTVGFLDDNLNSLDCYAASGLIIDTIRNYYPLPEDELICAIADPKTKVAICEDMLRRGGVFTNIIHPTAIVGQTCQLGKGVVMCYNSAVVENVNVGDFVMINGLSSIGHDTTIGKGCTINAHCDVMGGVSLGEKVFLGGGARILPRVLVGDEAKIGAGSIVVSNIKAGVTVFGNPARQIY